MNEIGNKNKHRKKRKFFERFRNGKWKNCFLFPRNLKFYCDIIVIHFICFTSPTKKRSKMKTFSTPISFVSTLLFLIKSQSHKIKFKWIRHLRERKREIFVQYFTIRHHEKREWKRDDKHFFIVLIKKYRFIIESTNSNNKNNNKTR